MADYGIQIGKEILLDPYATCVNTSPEWFSPGYSERKPLGRYHSNKAPFDRWIEGDETAISESAKRGFVAFNGKGNCAACHSDWRFTDDGFHDIGLKSDDIGRGAQVPDVQSLQHAFKTPTLRNIDQRAPYMHDGSLANLREVVVHYDTGFVERPSLSPEMHHLGLTEQEVVDLIEFMHTLTSRDDKISIPVLPTKEQVTWTR